MSNGHEIGALIRLVRACFHRLARAGDALHGQDGVTSAMRGVMESLYEEGARTVPDIARAKKVSRQHIQALADQLIVKGLATVARNPAHKRSHLLALTGEGAAVFERMRAREREVLAAFAAELEGEDLQSANRALRRFNKLLDGYLANHLSKESENAKDAA